MIPTHRKRLDKLEATIKRAKQPRPIITARIISAIDGRPVPAPLQTLDWDYSTNTWLERMPK
jgi:hypothetical protein